MPEAIRIGLNEKLIENLELALALAFGSVSI